MQTILVVDDTLDDLKTMETILKKEDYEVITATDGEKAVKTLEKKNVDLIVTNIKMPRLSGFDLLKTVKEEKKSKTPLIFVSIFPQKEIDTTSVGGFIQKPFSPESFLSVIKKTIKK